MRILPTRRPALLLALAALLSVMGPCGTAAAGDSASLQVTARVARHTSMRVAPPSTLTVTEADVARGYVELAAPVELAVRSNVQEGYTLFFERHGESVRQVRIQGLERELLVGAAGAQATRPAAGRGMWRDALQLRLRFELAPGAKAGTHPWPLHISMMSS